MSDVATLRSFEEALAAEGVTDAEVKTYDDPTGATHIAVRKRVNGAPDIKSDVSISAREVAQIDDMKQHVAILASRVARNIDEHLTEKHEWGDGKAVKLDLKEEKNAVCLRCGATASTDDLSRGHVSMSETAVPHPVTFSADSLSMSKLRMMLLALLRDECESYCPNAVENRKI